MTLTITPSFGTSLIPPVYQLIANASYGDLTILILLLIGGAAYISNGILWDKPDPYHYKWFERPQSTFTSFAADAKNTRNIAEKLTESGKQAVIFWGSQSGTAEAFAHRLGRDCRHRLKFEALVADISDYDHETIAGLAESQLAIFIVSTYGEGDPSDNSTNFVSWLKTNPDVSLRNLRFAAFGCGNSNYKYYNAVVDTVVASLENLGATRFLDIGRADEAKGTTEEDFLEWKSNLYIQLCKQYGLEEREPEYEPAIKIIEDDSIDISGVYLGDTIPQRAAKSSSRQSTPIVQLKIISAHELLAKNTQSRSCLHIEVDFADHPEIKYKTGDHLAVQPANPLSEVAALIRLLGLEGKEHLPIMIQAIDSTTDKTKIPSPTTVQALFEHYLEICAPVSRETVLSLVQFAKNSATKTLLLNLASDKAAYANFLSHNHITFARLLKLATGTEDMETWSELPLSFVIESLKPMAPRYYSISSSSITSPRRATITVANNPEPLRGNNEISIPGVTSTYLSSYLASRQATVEALEKTTKAQLQSTLQQASLDQASQPLQTLRASIRRSKFKLPTSPNVPLILIAAGTGIAPFRGFLHERARLASIHGQSKPMGRIILFFGCRHPDLDLLYKDELEELQDGSLNGHLEIVYAFSRLPGEAKVYVQDRVASRTDDVLRLLLEEDAGLYICGSATMAREVGQTITDAVRMGRGVDEDGVRKWREERKRAKRWQEDVWG